MTKNIEKIISNLTPEQVKNRFQYLEETLRAKQGLTLHYIQMYLGVLSSEPSKEEISSFRESLKELNQTYLRRTKNYKDRLGYESKELQEEYEKMLPEINKYLKLEEVQNE